MDTPGRKSPKRLTPKPDPREFRPASKDGDSDDLDEDASFGDSDDPEDANFGGHEPRTGERTSHKHKTKELWM